MCGAVPSAVVSSTCHFPEIASLCFMEEDKEKKRKKRKAAYSEGFYLCPLSENVVVHSALSHSSDTF